jgi:regulator of nonsense transcripts 1
MLQEQNKNFRIITPYDAQRSLIEEGLKASQLDWEDKCFNVDSFQGLFSQSILHLIGLTKHDPFAIGNEEDYIVISLVRSTALGFIADKRRTNVMLTRCKRGMIICTSQKFMERAGNNSLVGNLLGYYENHWVEKGELEKIEL